MPQTVDIDTIAATLENMYSLPFVAEIGRDTSGRFVDVRPAELHPNESFSVRTGFGWRSIHAEYRPGSYSADLIRAMGQSRRTAEGFRNIATAVSSDGATVQMWINGSSVDPFVPETWSHEWRTVAISLRRSGIIPDELNLTTEVIRWGGRLLGMILALLPADDMTEPDTLEHGIPEGAVTRVEVNRYERSRRNRAICIAVSGTSCAVCSFRFESYYGSLGAGYIHVHHTVPLSKLGEHYIIDPARDLVPVCPNCHAMIHQRDPPLSITELKSILAEHSER